MEKLFSVALSRSTFRRISSVPSIAAPLSCSSSDVGGKRYSSCVWAALSISSATSMAAFFASLAETLSTALIASLAAATASADGSGAAGAADGWISAKNASTSPIIELPCSSGMSADAGSASGRDLSFLRWGRTRVGIRESAGSTGAAGASGAGSGVLPAADCAA